MRKNFLLLLWLTLLPLAGWAQTAPGLAAPITWDGYPHQLITSAAGLPGGYNSSYAGGFTNVSGTWYDFDQAGIQYYVQEPGGAAPANGYTSVSNGWFTYQDEAESGFYNIAASTATAPGTYTVWYRVMRDHGTGSGTNLGNWINAGQVTIKIDLDYMPHYVSGPQRVSDLVYNDEEQTLITAGTQFCDYYDQGNGGVEYVVKTTHATPTSSDVVLSELPKAKDAGTYYVYYRVLKDGGIYTMDSPWNEVGVGGIEIAKRPIAAEDFTVTYAEDLTFTGNAQDLVTGFAWTGGITRGTVKYIVQYEEETPGAPATAAQGTHAGNYKVQVTIAPDANHKEFTTPAEDAKELTIKKATYKVKEPTIGTFTYDGTKQGPLATPDDVVVLSLAGAPGSPWYAGSGRIEYSITKTDASWVTNPNNETLKRTDAGTYKIAYRTKDIDANKDFEPVEGELEFTIDKADWVPVEPALTADWEYDAVEKALLAGEVTAPGALSTDVAAVSYYINEGEAIAFDAVKAKDVDDYEIYYSIAETKNYNAFAKKLIGTVSVTKHGLDIVAEGLTVTWTGTPVTAGELVKVDETDIPTAETLSPEEIAAALAGFKAGEFKLINEDLTETVVEPIPSDAGNYKFKLEAKENQNYKINNFKEDGTLTIMKDNSVAADVAAADLTYNGEDQELLTVDETPLVGGEMLYFVGEEAPLVGSTDWSTDIPVAKNAKDAYKVWYMLKGDKNHNDIAAADIDVVIKQKALADDMFELAATTAVYNGTDQTPDFTAADVAPAVLAETDFTVAKTNSVPEAVTEMVNVDTYTFTFEATADGNYTGTITKTFEITKKELADAMFTLSEDVTYSGAAQKPTITAVDGEPNALAEGDYTIEVKDGDGNIADIDNLVNADTYTFNFIATADGNYQGLGSAQWTIGQKALTAEMFTLSSYEEVYNGTDLMPDFTFADGTPSVLAETDFTVATTNSKPEAVTEMIDADTYTFTFTAAADGNYKGEVTATFVIAQDEAEFELAKANKLTYNGYDQALVTEAKTDAVDGKVEYQILSGEEVVVDWTEDFAAVVAKNAGDYTVKTKFTASEINYSNPEVVEEVAVTINIATIGYSLSNLTKDWDGELFAEEEISKLFTLSAGGDGTKLFGDDEYDKPFTLKLPEDYRDAGTYTFKQPKVEFKEGYPVNYNVTFNGTAEVIINKVDLVEGTDYTAPGAIGGLVYTPGVKQALVTDGSLLTEYAEDYPNEEIAGLPYGGTILFATAEDGEYSETVPTGMAADDYEVWFKVAGDINHNETKPVKIENTIAPALLTADFLPETYETELPYKAAKYEPTDFIPALDGIDLDEGYEVFAPELKDAGEYVILFQGINNYAGEDSKFEVTVKITPIDVIAIAPKDITKVYDGTASLEGVVDNKAISFVGVLSGDKMTLPETLALSTEGINVGTYAIKVDAAAINDLNNNYNVLDESIDGEVEITKAPAFTIGFDAVPTTWTKEFGEADPELTGYTVKVTDGEFFTDLADVLAATTAERAEGEDVGSYDVTLNIDATADVFANYEGVEFDGTAAEFTITKSSKTYTVSLANITETYKAEEFDTAIEIAAEDLVIAGYEGELDKFFTTLPTATIPAGAKNVGDYNITLSEGASTNYNFTFVPATFTIAPFEVTEATIEAQKVQKGKELDVTKFTIVAPEADAELFYVTAPGLVDMDDVVTGEAGVYADGLVIAVDESVADNYVGLDKFTAELEIIAADAIVLADDEDFVTEDKDGVDVTFASRTLNAGTWNVVALPFEATIAQISNAFGYAAVDILDESNKKTDEIHFMITTSGSIPAYTPFIVKTTDDEGLKKTNFDQVVFHNVNLEASEGENKAISDAAGNQFIGTFKGETTFWGKKYRYMSKGAWYNAAAYTESNPVKIKAFRGYIEMVNASARIFIEEPDGTVTAIDAVNFNKAEAEGMYNLNGVKVNNANRKGVFIQNGKKVINK
jgi:hypothetical protein